MSGIESSDQEMASQEKAEDVTSRSNKPCTRRAGGQQSQARTCSSRHLSRKPRKNRQAQGRDDLSKRQEHVLGSPEDRGIWKASEVGENWREEGSRQPEEQRHSDHPSAIPPVHSDGCRETNQ